MGGGWVRPVSTEDGGPLFSRHYAFEDLSEPQVLDVIRVSVEKPCPLQYQPENWLINGSLWSLLRCDAYREYSEMLDKHLDKGSTLLGDSRSYIPASELEKKPMASSLQLVKPTDLHWRVEGFNGNRKVRALFRLGTIQYDLPFTDTVYHGVLARHGVGTHPLNAIGLANYADLLLTISLIGPIDDKCYKLASGLVILAKDQPHREDKSSLVRLTMDWGLLIAKHVWRSLRR